MDFTNTLCLFIVLLSTTRTSDADPELKCLVCRKVVDEIEHIIKKENPNKKIQVGGYRIDDKGDQKQNQIPYAGSEIHIHDILDQFCDRMDDYAQGKFKDTGERTIIKLIGSDGKMNVDMSKVDLLPDPDLNKMLKYYCENFLEDFEDELVNVFTKKFKDPDIELCTKTADWCQDNLQNDEDYNFEDRDEL
uniref:Saposin B-type domain-containing protein n=1 Tax=Strigamia maritima TaxID=126957 RepID=T1J2X4_STRMM